MASNGTVILAAWSEATGVYVARIDAGDATVLDSTPIRVGTSSASTVDVASVGDDFLVVWSGGTGVSGRIVSEAGAPSPASPITVNASGSQPAVTGGSSNYLVTWSSASQIEATVLDATGTSLTNGGFVVSADGARPAAASNGSSFLVSWAAAAGTQILAQRFSTTGTALDAAPTLLTSSPVAGSAPTAAYTSSGYFVAWADTRGTDADIYAAYIDASTGLPGSAIPIAEAAGDQSQPSAAGSGSVATIAFVVGGAVHFNRYDGTLLDGGSTSNGAPLSTATPASSPDVAAWASRVSMVWVQQDRVWGRAPVEETQTTPGEVAFGQAAVTVSESAGTLSVTVERTGGVDGDVTIDYATAGGTASAGSDFTARTGTLSWAGGDANPKTITIPILDDATVEGPEAFTVTLSGPTGGATIGTAQLEVTIEDDDSASVGTVAFSSSSFTVLEDGGQLVVTVQRVGGTDGEASVAYGTSNGTASAGSDYVSNTGTLNWADGQGGAKSFILEILDDANFEGNETVTLTLGSATGATMGAPSTATVTITDDDDAARGTLGFDATSHSADESQGSVVLTVSRTGGDDGTVSLRFATQDLTASAGSDYQATNGVLTWNDGDASPKTITVAVLDDQTTEGSESFAVALTNVTGGATLGSTTALVTIRDDEGPSHGSLGVASDTLSAPEGSAVDITVRRTGGSDGAVSVDYETIAVGATEGTDYDGTSGTLTWGAGDETDKTITVTIRDDSDFENGESFQLQLSNPTGGAVLGATTATVTIIDDEEAIPGLIGFSEAEYSATEEEALVTLFVGRTGGDGEVTVKYETLPETAGDGDFTGVSGRMRWADGDLSLKRIDVPITQDSELEKDETFTVVLSEVTGGAAIDLGTALVTIIDDDADEDPDVDPDPAGSPGVASFVEETVTVSEADGVVSVLVERSGGDVGEVSVDWQAVGATALAGSDFEEGSGTLTWADGESGTKSFEITIIDDATSENSQHFWVTLSNPSEGFDVEQDTLTVAVQDDDARPDTGGGDAEEGGCGGCATGSSAPDASWLLLMGAAIALRRRRRA